MSKKSKIRGAKAPRASGKSISGTVQPLLAFAGGPMVTALIAEALTAGAQALAKPKTFTTADEAREEDGDGAMDAVVEAGSDAADMASLAGYAIAIAAAAIAAHIIASYEGRMGDAKSVRRTAKAAKKAADMAWAAFGAKGG